jgi:hypothetical protein
VAVCAAHCVQVLLQDCYFTSAQAGQMVAAFSYGEDKVQAAVKVSCCTGCMSHWHVVVVATRGLCRCRSNV